MTESMGLPLKAVDWDGQTYPPRWRVTGPWPQKVWLRWYDVTQTKKKKCVSRYSAENGHAVYSCVKDEFGDWDCELVESSYTPYQGE